MFRENRVRQVLLILFVLLLSCVNGSIRHVRMNNELPSDFPKELKDRFEIKDVTSSIPNLLTSDVEVSKGPSPASFSEPAIESKVSKKKKKRMKIKEEHQKELARGTVHSAPFVYPIRRPGRDPIWVGEKFVYSILYLGVPAGSFTLEILPFKTISNRKVYHIRGNAVSSTIFSLFYRLNDIVESFMDYEGSFSHRFHIILDESKQSRDALELYDSEKAQTFYWNRWDHKVNGYKESKEFAAIQPFSQDSLSALYFMRTLALPPDSVISFPVVSEGKGWEAICNVVRREMLRTPFGKVQTIVIRPDTKFQGILRKNGNSFLWLTDDDRKIPVRLEAKVRIGTVVAELRHVELGTPPAAEVNPLATPKPDSTPLPTP